MDFIGEKCAACHEVFTADDDIVVCPDCGSPHHRDCYMKEKKCANADKHLSGYKWARNKSTDSEGTGVKQQDITVRVCPVCKLPNLPESERCVRCGARLEDASAENGMHQENERPDMEYGPNAYTGIDNTLSFLGFDPNEDMGGIAFCQDKHYLLYTAVQEDERLWKKSLFKLRMSALAGIIFCQQKNVVLGIARRHCKGHTRSSFYSS